MRVLRIQARNFRLLRDVDIKLNSRLNLIIGDNAAGKTSLLETLYTASYGRPAGVSYEDACGPDASAWHVCVQGQAQEDHPPTEIKISFRNRRHFQQIDGLACSRADLARLLPLASLNSKAHGLVAEGPSLRRKFLDWGLFHVEQGFLETWKRYHRALRQRNAVLRRNGSGDQLIPWNIELESTAQALDDSRQRCLVSIQETLQQMLSRLVGADDWSISLERGWSVDRTLLEILEATENSDRRAGTTQHGPHRAELSITRNNSEARRRVSRGEEKLVAASMLLVQAGLISKATGAGVTLLVDDFGSELGDAAQSRLLEALLETGSQIVITTLTLNEILRQSGDASMFHVEHGVVSRVVN